VDELLTELAALPPDHPRRAHVREAAVRAGLPLAQQLARRYRDRGQPLDDLTQVAYVGLVKAVDGYDPFRGHHFVSFAIPTILGELRRYFRDHTWGVRVPRRLQELRLRIGQAVEELTVELRRSPTVAELAAHLDVDDEQVIEAQVASGGYRTVSIFRPVGEEGGELIELMGGYDPQLETAADRASLPPAIRALPARQQQIIMLRFYGNCSQTQIAEQLGISQMHVSRLLSRALTTLRHQLLPQA
jgi:RNA polymerase sigma-B factor